MLYIKSFLISLDVDIRHNPILINISLKYIINLKITKFTLTDYLNPIYLLGAAKSNSYIFNITNYTLMLSHSNSQQQHKLEINKEWLEWFVGFTDAEGSFSIVKFKNNNVRFFFRIRLHKDDIKVLQEIATILNLLPPFLDGNSAVLQVTKLTHIVNVMVPVYTETALLTIKSVQFNLFKEAVFIKNRSIIRKTPLTTTEYNYIIKLKNSMKEAMDIVQHRDTKCQHVDKLDSISPYWRLLGFVEGEGTFGYRSLVPYFQVCQHSRDIYVLNLVKKFLESLPLDPLTNISCKQSSFVTKIFNKKTNVYSYIISDLDVLFNIIVPFFSKLKFKTR